MAAADYHADPCPEPSLSSSIAKILAWKTPRHAWQEHPRLNDKRETKSESKFDIGSAAHEVLLGRGAGIDVINFDDYRKKEAQELRDKARAAGRTPLLDKEMRLVTEMCWRVGGRLQEEGISLTIPERANEVVAIWQEPGLWLRAMMDSYAFPYIDDLKTTEASLDRASLERQIANLNYDLSAAFYIRGMEALFPELKGKLKFRWIFVEAKPPHELRVMEASGMTLEIGARKVQFAIDKWRACMASGEWPGYPKGTQTAFLPSWAEAAWLDRESEASNVRIY
jgi:hypothetical protein